MKKYSRILSFILVFAVVIQGFPSLALASNFNFGTNTSDNKNQYIDFLTEGDFQYIFLNDGTAQIVNYIGEENLSGTNDIIIPDMIGGKTVSALADEVFMYNSFIDSVVVPKSVETIGNAVFYHCDNLKFVAFLGEDINFGFTAFEGSKNLEKILIVDSYDASLLSSIIVNDLGEVLATNIEFVEFSDEEELLEVYDSFKVNLGNAYENSEHVSVDTYSAMPTNMGVVDSGECGAYGDNLTWMLSEYGELIIAGLGDMADYSESSPPPWSRYSSQIMNLQIGSDVTSIGNYAFSSMFGGMTLYEVVIPNKITKIGDYAFTNSYLTGLYFYTENLISIGEAAFSGCMGITGDLMIPESVQSIGSGAFSNCGFTGILKLPERVDYIGSGTFADNYFTNIIFGENFQGEFGISENPIFNFSNVEEMTFHGLTVVPVSVGGMPDDHSFSSANNLKKIYVPLEVYDEYVSAYSSYVDASVKFVSFSLQSKVEGLNVENLYSKSVNLSWEKHEDSRVGSYNIYRDGVLVGNTAQLSYYDENLTVDTLYRYSVRGRFLSGALCSPSDTVTATTSVPVINDIKTEGKYGKVREGENTISIEVVDGKNLESIDNRNINAKLYYLENETRVLIGDAVIDENSQNPDYAVYKIDWDISDLPEGDYDLVFVIIDIDYLSSEFSKTVNVDHTVPEKIQSAVAVGDVDVINLNWSISKEIDSDTYHIYRKSENEADFTEIAQISNRNTLSYADADIEKDLVYQYYIVVSNSFEEKSQPSTVTSASLSDDSEKPVVTKLSVANGTYIKGDVSLTVTATDNLFVSQVEISYSTGDGDNWHSLGIDNKAPFSKTLSTTSLSDGEIKVKAVAVDSSSNESDELVYTYFIDNTGPEKVEGFSAESTSATITLKWNNVADKDISFYRVEQKEQDGDYTLYRDVTNTLGLNVYNLSPNTQYTYRVVGYDINGNRGISSDDLIATTKNDEAKPIVTQIRPLSGYFSGTINLSVVASDEYSVSNIKVQTSQDGQTWTDVYKQEYTDISKSRSLSYNLSLEDYAEGKLFVRALATDWAGNESESGISAPYVQHVVDKTAPEKPQDVSATGFGGYIEISWTQGTELDLNKYSVYKSEIENGNYTLLATNLQSLNYIDRSVEENKIYYYKVFVNDLAGNESELSNIVSASIIDDTEKPIIVSVYPEKNSYIGTGYKTISVLATDNNKLDSVLLQYSTDGVNYEKLYEKSEIDNYNYTLKTDLPINLLSDASVLYVRIFATDKSGNVSDGMISQYIADKTAPLIKEGSGTYYDDSVLISWEGFDEEDLIGYRVYRKVSDSGSYSFIYQKQIEAGNALYSYYDYNIPDQKSEYTYKIEAVDSYGNVSEMVLPKVEIPDRSYPTAIISCESIFEVGVEYLIDASFSTDNSKIVSYEFDFGDGTTSADLITVHSFDEVGEKKVKLTVTDDDGNISSTEKLITVKERSLIGTAKIKVVDEDGLAVPGAPVYFDLGEENQTIKYTDKDGFVSFSSDVGRYTVGCVISNNEWLPTKKDVIISAGEETETTLVLINHVMIEGDFDVERMTFEEIVAAGIDVSKLENQHYLKVDMSFTYGTEEVETRFEYNMSTGLVTSEPVIITTPLGEQRQILPVVIVPDFGYDEYQFAEETSIAFLDIPVGVSSLKEFFNVNLHIINNASSEFSMLDNVINLNIPHGLTIMDTDETQSSSNVLIDEIGGKSSKTLTWILRGDEVGEYYISADYSGILSQFNTRVDTRFESDEAIEVYGLSDVKLLVEIPDLLDKGTFYYNASFINNAKIDMFMPNIDTGDVLIETELFDATGADYADEYELNAGGVTEFGVATSISGNVETLMPGGRITKHYMSIDQTDYTNLEMVLQMQIDEITQYAKELQNTYGIDVEIVVKPLSYFKSSLSTAINPMEKADATLNENMSAYEYLMRNENYIYWSLYESTDELEGELTTDLEEDLWNLLTVLGDDGFKSLFGVDDEELIAAIVTDVMEIAVGDSNYSTYKTTVDWLESAVKFLNQAGIKDFLSEQFDMLGESLPHVFEVISLEYKYEFYKIVTEGEYFDLENFIIYKWIEIIEFEYAEINIELEETDLSVILHEVFSSNGFEVVWTAIEMELEIAKEVVNAFGQLKTDISLFVKAQANINNCNLFLNTLIEYTPDTSDGDKVVNAAKDIKNAINEIAPIRSIIDYMFENLPETLISFTVDEVLDKASGNVAKIVKGVKLAMKLIDYIGNNIFNVSERNDIADKVRFISQMTIALQRAIPEYQSNYLLNKTESTAQEYMQLISYMIDIREIGESQVSEFGMTYEILPVVADSKELFLTVKEMSGAYDANSWIEWRDYVQDKLSVVRVDLLKNPLTTDVSGATGPTVTFNYEKGETDQAFSSEYEYYLDDGKGWRPGDGSAIQIEFKESSTLLYVRRVDASNSDESMMTKRWILPPQSITNSGIVVAKTQSGYEIQNLDSEKNYEVTFAKEEIMYHYRDFLETQIPRGSDSYELSTDENYDYIYIRRKVSPDAYASYILSAEVVPMFSVNVFSNGIAIVEGEGNYMPGETATLTVSLQENYEFSGWYIGDVLLSTQTSYSFEVDANYEIFAKLTYTGKYWTLDSENSVLHGIEENTSAQDVIDYYTSLGHTTSVENSTSNVGTGTVVTIDGNEYVIVIPGDTTGDGSIDLFDIIAVIDYTSGRRNLSGAYFEAAEINKDGNVNLFDIFKMVDIVKGKGGEII